MLGRDPQAAPQEAAGAYWAPGPPPRRRRAAGRGGPGRPRRAAASHLSSPPQIGPALPKSCLSSPPQICAALLRFGYSPEKGSAGKTSLITQAPPCGATSVAHLPEQPRQSLLHTPLAPAPEATPCLDSPLLVAPSAPSVVPPAVVAPSLPHLPPRSELAAHAPAAQNTSAGS